MHNIAKESSGICVSAFEKDCQRAPGMPDFTKMNDSQRQAVTHGEGPLLLLAGPGSGKTFTITNRILYLLNNGVTPEKILVITFTREAAQSMQNRFRTMCGKISYPVNFGTFHSYFYHILRESNVLKSYKLLSNSEKIQILLPVLNEYVDKKDDMAFLREDAGKLLSCFGYYKNTLCLQDTLKNVPQFWQEKFEAVFHTYQGKVAQMGRLDFDDILFRCKSFLESNPAARDAWCRRFSHILIDEFQDINPVQYETIKLLVDKPFNIFAVGDDDQAIYGFRGSKPDCMKQFAGEYHARQLLLDVNYRSTPEIVKASLAVIGENQNRFDKRLISTLEWGGREQSGRSQQPDGTEQSSGERGVKQEEIMLSSFPDKYSQYEYLLQGLKEKMNPGESCAVLFRTNQYMQGFAVWLARANLPYEMREKSVSIYEHFIVADIMAYLQLSQGRGSREQLLRVMNKPSRYIQREAAAMAGGKVDFSKMQKYYRQAYYMEGEQQTMLRRLSAFEKQLNVLSRMSIMPAISYILKVIGYEQYLKEQAGNAPEKLKEWQDIIQWLKEDGEKYKNLEEWLEFQQNYCEGMSSTRYPDTDAKSKIQLMTVHASKGLEFDHVWIPDCNERVYPHGRMPDENQVEEERRIFYVAMTRAKKSLELLYIKGTKERPRQPSAFLNPLYSSTNSSNSQLSRYSSNASATFSYSSSSSI